MKVLPPVVVTDAMIVESSLFEAAPAVYPSGLPFAVNAYTAVAGLLGEIKIYKNILADTTGANPPATSPTYWVYSSSTYEAYSPTTTYPLSHRVRDPITRKIYESTWGLFNYGQSLTGETRWVLSGKASTIGVPEYIVSTESTDRQYTQGEVAGRTNPATGVQLLYRYLQGYDSRFPRPFPENDPAYWRQVGAAYPLHDLTKTYALGALVTDGVGNIYTSAIPNNYYQSLENIRRWAVVGGTNKNAMFDIQTSTQSVANKSLSVTITPGIIEAIGLINCLGDTATATLRDGLGGPVVWTQSSGIAGEQVSDWYQYFFNDPTIQRTQLLFTTIPPYNNGHLTVTITGGGTVAVGDLLVGRWRDVGLTGFGLQVGITDFSIVKDDDFGATTFNKRGNKKYMNSRDWVKKEGFNRAFNLLRQLPATPCLWLAGDVFDYSEALMLKAFYKDFFIDIDGLDEAYCTLKLIGTI